MSDECLMNEGRLFFMTSPFFCLFSFLRRMTTKQPYDYSGSSETAQTGSGAWVGGCCSMFIALFWFSRFCCVYTDASSHSPWALFVLARVLLVLLFMCVLPKQPCVFRAWCLGLQFRADGLSGWACTVRREGKGGRWGGERQVICGVRGYVSIVCVCTSYRCRVRATVVRVARTTLL